MGFLGLQAIVSESIILGIIVNWFPELDVFEIIEVAGVVCGVMCFGF